MRNSRRITRRGRRLIAPAKGGKPVMFYDPKEVDEFLQLIDTASRAYPNKDLKIEKNGLRFEVKEPGISTHLRLIIGRVLNHFFNSPPKGLDN
ncbi:MAG: hypothetical protein P8X96_06680 [Desulfobacteraceae bacterium]|jgi:hypothetical protein